MILKHKLILCIVFLLSAGKMVAQVGSFVDIPNNPVSVAMGNTYVAGGGNAFSVFENLSSVAFSDHKAALGYSYRPWMNDWISGYALNSFAGYFQFKERHALAVGVRMFSNPSVRLSDDNGNELGQFQPRESSYGMGYAYRINERMALSATVSYLTSELSDGYKGNAVYTDLGFRTSIKKLDVGVMVRNLGSKISVDGNQVGLPLTFISGGSYGHSINEKNALKGNFDLGYTSTDAHSGIFSGLGLQYGYRSLVFLRTGYRYAAEEIGFSAFSAGGGLRVLGGSVDFAWLLADNALKNNYSVSMSWRF